MYSYRYVVSNDAGSAQEVKSFDLDFAPPASNFTNPQGWLHSTFPQRSTLGWFATFPPGTHTPSTVAVPQPLPKSNPGSPRRGFSRFRVRSRRGPVKYYVEGIRRHSRCRPTISIRDASGPMSAKFRILFSTSRSWEPPKSRGFHPREHRNQAAKHAPS